MWSLFEHSNVKSVDACTVRLEFEPHQRLLLVVLAKHLAFNAQYWLLPGPDSSRSSHWIKIS